MDPDTDGTVGQVIQFWNGDPDRPLVADSLEQFLEGFYQGALTGLYVDKTGEHKVKFDKEYGVEFG